MILIRNVGRKEFFDVNASVGHLLNCRHASMMVTIMTKMELSASSTSTHIPEEISTRRGMVSRTPQQRPARQDRFMHEVLQAVTIVDLQLESMARIRSRANRLAHIQSTSLTARIIAEYHVMAHTPPCIPAPLLEPPLCI